MIKEFPKEQKNMGLIPVFFPQLLVHINWLFLSNKLFIYHITFRKKIVII